jgi:2-iminoacetate synthase
MIQHSETVPFDVERIEAVLAAGEQAPARVREVLAKALELKGLDENDVAALTTVRDPGLLEELFAAARFAKEEIYGKRLVLFAPMYVSNLCHNECLYCAFRKSNPDVVRLALTQEQVAQETRALIDQGHKRVLLVAGESYPEEGLSYIFKCIETIYSVKNGNGEVRRVNVNLAPLTVDEFKDLKKTGIGTFQLFQETYHRPTYAQVHTAGRKRDYDWRVTAMDRAMEAHIDDVGMGVLLGLYDWRFEVLSMMQHVAHLEKRFGVGCHTLSVPRIEPAVGSAMSTHPPHAVSDGDFKKIVAILRLAVPYTGIIMSTRETAEMRRDTLALGVSQISAGSRTNPGGYCDEEHFDTSQFQVGDHRPLDQVVREISEMDHIPSFCTGCYRMGRTGEDFMDLAKPGLIKSYCGVNALSTFVEFLQNYASPETKAAGEACITRTLAGMPDDLRDRAQGLMNRVRTGERDVYV